MKKVYWIIGSILILLTGIVILIYSVLHDSNAGKECSNSDECKWFCIAELSDEDNEKLANLETVFTTGECTEWEISKGCYNLVEEGMIYYVCYD